MAHNFERPIERFQLQCYIKEDIGRLPHNYSSKEFLSRFGENLFCNIVTNVLTLWTPEDSIPTFRKLPNAAKLRYTVQTASYRTRRPTVYHRYGSSDIRAVGRYTIAVY